MRFISKYAKYMVNVRGPIVESYATGVSKEIQRGLVAQFDVAIPNADERALARQLFSFNGFAQEQDMVTVVEPDARISGYDTRLAQAEHGWTDDERELVEQKLLDNARLLLEDLILVEQPAVAPPWPNYDTFKGNGAELLAKVEEDGYDLDEVLAYERQAQNRADVVELLESAIEHFSFSRPAELEEELVG